jgi:hypothetical protein
MLPELQRLSERYWPPSFCGSRQYAMRIWLKTRPDAGLQHLKSMTDEVAFDEQSVIGLLAALSSDGAAEVSGIRAHLPGRFNDVEQYRNVIPSRPTPSSEGILHLLMPTWSWVWNLRHLLQLQRVSVGGHRAQADLAPMPRTSS